MAHYSNYSVKDRAYRDSDTFKRPDLFEVTKVNELALQGFQRHKSKWRELCSYFRHYPDHFLDFIAPEKPRIKLFFFQRVYLRIMMRYQKVFLTATRGTSKSFLQNLAFVLKCIMYPNNKLFCCGPGKEQVAKITQECLNDIFEFWPLLKCEVRRFTENKDYTRVVFYNGSRYDVVQMRDSTRGGRRTTGAIEEISDEKFDGDMLNSTIIPLMANSRTAMCGGVDPNEIHKGEIYLTTAGTQQQFAYKKLQEVYGDMLAGKSAFCLGNSYELPCMHNHLDIDFVEEKKDSPTYSIADFMREYQSIWTGSSSGSLVSDEKLKKSRVVGIAEWEHCGDDNVEYCLAYDVSRSEGAQNALSCLAVIKMTPRSRGEYVKELVNIFSMEGQHSLNQAKFLKQKVKEYKARILVIDNGGLGVAVTDQLVLDLDDGNPPYSVVNDSRYDRYTSPDSVPMVFAVLAQSKETHNSHMINNFMQVFNRFDIGLLVSPHEGLGEMEKKLRRRIRDSEEIASVQVPYLLTENLCEEVLNLVYRQAGRETKVDRVSNSIQKDKFSALMYGLFWIYLQEKKNKQYRSQTNINISDLFSFKKPQLYKR